MALSCFLRGIPKTFEVCSRQYLISRQLPKFSAIISNSQLQQTCYQSTVASEKELGKQFPLPALQNCNQPYSINLNHVKNFSVSPNRYSDGQSHDHSKLWSVERGLSAAMLGILPAAFIFPSQIMDCVLAVALVMHNHWGIEAVVIDYVREIIFGPIIPKIALGLVYAMSIITLVGLYYLIFNDCGLVNIIKMLWKL